jgi:hypothetical protein
MSKKIDLPPKADNFIDSQRKYGYSFQSALADIIDNSITAKSRNLNINFFPGENSLTILDDGHGMSEKELIDAMVFGSGDPSKPRAPDDLGRFGMGLKSASISQCKKLIVISRKDQKFSGAIWDVDLIKKTGKWTLEVLNKNDIKKFLIKHEVDNFDVGTLVIWDNIDSIQGNAHEQPDEQNRNIANAKDHLRLTFHRFLELKSKPLKIIFNGDNLSPLNPFLEGKSQETSVQQIPIPKTKKYVAMQGYTLPSISRMSNKQQKELELDKGFAQTQGFYIYRNKRLISPGGWFGLERYQATTNLSRVRVDVPNFLDHEWGTDIKKTQMRPPPAILNSMKILLRRFHDPSKKIYKRKAKKSIEKSKIWLRAENSIENRLVAQYGIDDKATSYHSLTKSLNKKQTDLLDQLMTDVIEDIPYASIFADYADKKVKQ